jgi:hypothetical protein
LQAVTRVKLEQASKAAMWTPTRRKSGEGRADWEEPGAGARYRITVRTRIKEKVGDLLEPSNVKPWAEVCERLNQKLQGWRAYFGCGSTAKAYRAVDEHVYDAVRHFLRRRHKVTSQGTHQFPEERVSLV